MKPDRRRRAARFQAATGNGTDRYALERLATRILFSADLDAVGGLLAPPTDSHWSRTVAPQESAVTDAAERNTRAERVELVIIDAAVPDARQLAERLRTEARDGITVHLLEPGEDALERIGALVAAHEGIDAVHLISHGDDGLLQLGDETIDTAALLENADALAGWKAHLDADADILIYGCDVAAGTDGERFVRTFAELTGADVAASDDVTGHASRGGDWELEHARGTIESSTVASASVRDDWSGTLARITHVSNTTATTEVQEIKATEPVGQTFAHSSGNGTYTVNEVDLVLWRDAAAPPQTLNVTLRTAWDGPVLRTATIESSALGTSQGWHTFGFADVELDDGVEYVIQVTTTGGDKVYAGFDKVNGYADGDKITKDGSVDSGKDLSFRIANEDPSLTVVSYAANRDTYVDLGEPNTSHGGATSLLIDRETGDKKAILVGFDISAVPSGATIEAAYVDLELLDVGGDMDIEARQIVESWNEGQATWNQRESGVPWGTTSGSTIFDSLTLAGGQTGTVSLDITALARDWHSGTAVNHGVTIVNPETGGDREAEIGSREGGSGASLRIVYSLPPNTDPTVTSASSFSIDENASAVGTVVGDDVDGDTLQYSIVGSADDSLFTIDASSGALGISARNFEAPTDGGGDNDYDLTVQVDDGRGGVVTQAIRVTIRDVDEFEIDQVSDTDAALDRVDENASVGTSVGVDLFASDADGTDSVTYSLDNDAGGLFAIDPGTGVVTVNGALDRESTSFHNLTARATSDDGSFSTRSFSITVNDVDEVDIGATTDSDGTADSVAENAGENDLVGITAAATDADATDDVTYSLTDNAGGRFQIDATAGVVTVASGASFDAETTASHDITVLSTSDDGSTSSEDFTIAVANVNEAPVITSVSSVSVDENQTAALTVTSTDVDGGAPTYSIAGGADAARFAIDDTTGELTFQSTPDFESPADANTDNTYEVVVEVSDGNGGTASQAIAVTVADADDASVVSGTVTGAVAEGDVGDAPVTASGTLSISDPDDGDAPSFTDVVATTGDNAYGSFELTGGTWTYTLDQSAVQELDAGDGVSDTITYTATDGSTQQVTVTISGTDDASVVGGTVTGAVTEGDVGDAPVTASGTLSITDPDDSDSPSFTDVVATTGDNSYGSFELTGGTWTYTLDQSAVQELDAGDTVSDTITYTATDGSTQQVTVTITGTDDASVVGGTVTGAVTEGDVGDAPVTASGSITISDVDGDDAPSFVDVGATASDNAYGSFALSGGTWTYTLDQSAVQNLDAGDTVSDTITYTATDGSTQQVTVAITGSDDASVVSGTVTGAVAEGDVGDAPVTASGALTISDVDGDDAPSFVDVGPTAGDNAYGSFELTGGTWTYTLDQSAVQDLDAGDTVSDTITYTATDGSTQQVTVTISGTDDASVVSGTVSGAVTEGDVGDAPVTASGALTISDVDGDDSPSFVDIGATAGDNAYGSFTLSGGTWTYALDQSAVQELDAGDSVSDTITYTATDGSIQQVTVTIAGTDDASVISGTVSGAVTEGDVGDAPVTASGALTISDVDGDDAPSFTDVGSTAGDNAYGSFELTGGTWTYTLDQSAVQNLGAGDSVSDTITYAATDGATQQVTVTITGADDASVVSGTVTGAVTEGDVGDAPVTASGTLSITDPDPDNSPSFVDVGPTAGDNAYGSFELTGGTWTYTLDQSAVQNLDAGDGVSDTITYTATDGSTQQVTVTISGTDDASVVSGTVTGAVVEGDVGDAPATASGALTISDVDGDDSPNFMDVGATAGDNAHGSFELTGGTWTYTLDQSAVQNLDAGDSVSDTITYTATDGSTQQVTVTITGTDDAPVISGTVTGAVAEGDVGDAPVTASGTLSITDPDDGDAPSFTDVVATTGDNAYGSFELAGGTWTYTLDQSAVQNLGAGDSVSDTITYAATDGATQQVTVTISGTDDASVVGGTVTGAVTEGDVGDAPVTASGPLSISDPDDSDSPSFTDVGATAGDNAYGSFELSGGTWTYRLDQSAVQDLDAGDNVSDTTTYTATDGSTQQVTVTISGNDDVSVISGTVTGAVTEGDVGDAPVTASGPLSISDPDDSDSPSFTDVGATAGDNAYGSFELTGGTWTYTLDQSAVQDLDAGDTVSDTITYTATDGSTQQVTVTITGTDDVSVISGTVTGAVTEGDVGDAPVTASGTLSIADPDDGDAPSFTDVVATTGDNAYGSFELTGGTWTYTLDQSAVQALDAGDTVSDTITYTATDGSTQQVTVTISGTDDASVVSGTVSGAVTEGDVGDAPVTASGTLSITDPDDGDAPSFTDVVATTGDNAYGSFELTGGTWTYTLDQSAVQELDAGDSVSDTITYTATDGSTQQVTVTITGTDDVSVISGTVTGAVTEGDVGDAPVTASGTLSITDPDDGDAPSYTDVGSTAGDNAYGSFTLSGGTWTYTLDQSAVQELDAGDTVSDTITYTATDGSTQQVTVTITGTDDAPVISGTVTGAVAEGDVGDAPVTASGTLSISDPDDGDSPSFTDVGATAGDNAYGSFELTGGTWTYTLDQSAVQNLGAGDSVSDTITYAATDGATQQVTVTITGADDASLISGTVSGTVTEGDVGDAPVTASGTLSITDPDDGDSPSFIDVGATAGDNAYGSFELTGGTWTYTLDQSAVQNLGAGDSVSDTITYAATDGATQQVTVTITGADDASLISGTVSGAVTEGDVGDAPATASGTLSISDPDPDNSPSFVDVGPTAGDNAYGSFELTGGTWTYTLDQSAVQDLDAGDSVSDTITYTATDGSTQQVTVTISGTDDASVISGTVSGTVTEGDVGDAPATASGTLSISDPDQDNSPSFVDVGPTAGDNAYGSFELTGGTWTYTLDQSAVQNLDAGDNVSDTITYTATDGSTQQVTVTITGTDDASVVSGTVTGAVTEGDVGDAPVIASGPLSISDPDDSDSPSFTDVGATAGDNSYGSFELTGGTWTYTLDQSAVQELDAGDTVSDTITYTAIDGSTQQVTVTITGTDDASVISGTVTGAVTEGDVGDAPVTASGALTISDVDGDDAPSFVGVGATAGDNAYGSFELTGGTWSYTLDQSAVQALDAGESVSDTITYTATDGSTQQVTVTITGTNDIPHFISADSVGVAENRTAVLPVVVADADEDVPAYSIVGGADRERFTIDPIRGTLAFQHAPDFESPSDADGDNVYEVVVEADDGSGGTASKSVRITIRDVDEFKIGAINDVGVAADTVLEGAVAGTHVGIVAAAIDADGTDTVTYSLSDSAAGRFAIDPASGVVTVAITPSGELDHESETSHTITVEARSSDGSSATRDFTVQVGDLNEFSLGPIADIDDRRNAVAENLPTGTVVGVTAAAFDLDGTATVSYSLDNDADGRFVIDASTGEIAIARSLDHEEADRHTVVIRAESNDGTITSRTFEIGVEDVNEAPVLETREIDVSVGDGDVLMTVAAFDPDRDDVLEFSLVENDVSALFSIDARSGQLTLADDDLPKGTYELRVAMTDRAGVRTVETLRIEIFDDGPSLGAATDSGDTTEAYVDTRAEVSSAESIAAGRDLESIASGVDSDITLGAAPDGSAALHAEPPTGMETTSENPASGGILLPIAFDELRSGEEGNPRGGAHGARESTGGLDRHAAVFDFLVRKVGNDTASLTETIDRLFEELSDEASLPPQLLDALRAMKSELAQLSETEREEHEVVRHLTAAFGAGVAGGFLVWLFKSGLLAAATMTTTSLWYSFDPIPVAAKANGPREETDDAELED